METITATPSSYFFNMDSGWLGEWSDLTPIPDYLGGFYLNQPDTDFIPRSCQHTFSSQVGFDEFSGFVSRGSIKATVSVSFPTMSVLQAQINLGVTNSSLITTTYLVERVSPSNVTLVSYTTTIESDLVWEFVFYPNGHGPLGDAGATVLTPNGLTTIQFGPGYHTGRNLNLFVEVNTYGYRIVSSTYEEGSWNGPGTGPSDTTRITLVTRTSIDFTLNELALIVTGVRKETEDDNADDITTHSGSLVVISDYNDQETFYYDGGDHALYVSDDNGVTWYRGKYPPEWIANAAPYFDLWNLMSTWFGHYGCARQACSIDRINYTITAGDDVESVDSTYDGGPSVVSHQAQANVPITTWHTWFPNRSDWGDIGGLQHDGRYIYCCMSFNGGLDWLQSDLYKYFTIWSVDTANPDQPPYEVGSMGPTPGAFVNTPFPGTGLGVMSGLVYVPISTGTRRTYLENGHPVVDGVLIASRGSAIYWVESIPNALIPAIYAANGDYHSKQYQTASLITYNGGEGDRLWLQLTAAHDANTVINGGYGPRLYTKIGTGGSWSYKATIGNNSLSGFDFVWAGPNTQCLIRVYDQNTFGGEITRTWQYTEDGGVTWEVVGTPATESQGASSYGGVNPASGMLVNNRVIVAEPWYGAITDEGHRQYLVWSFDIVNKTLTLCNSTAYINTTGGSYVPVWNSVQLGLINPMQDDDPEPEVECANAVPLAVRKTNVPRDAQHSGVKPLSRNGVVYYPYAPPAQVWVPESYNTNSILSTTIGLSSDTNATFGTSGNGTYSNTFSGGWNASQTYEETSGSSSGGIDPGQSYLFFIDGGAWPTVYGGLIVPEGLEGLCIDYAWTASGSWETTYSSTASSNGSLTYNVSIPPGSTYTLSNGYVAQAGAGAEVYGELLLPNGSSICYLKFANSGDYEPDGAMTASGNAELIYRQVTLDQLRTSYMRSTISSYSSGYHYVKSGAPSYSSLDYSLSITTTASLTSTPTLVVYYHPLVPGYWVDDPTPNVHWYSNTIRAWKGDVDQHQWGFPDSVVWEGQTFYWANNGQFPWFFDWSSDDLGVYILSQYTLVSGVYGTSDPFVVWRVEWSTGDITMIGKPLCRLVGQPNAPSNVEDFYPRCILACGNNVFVGGADKDSNPKILVLPNDASKGDAWQTSYIDYKSAGHISTLVGTKDSTRWYAGIVGPKRGGEVLTSTSSNYWSLVRRRGALYNITGIWAENDNALICEQPSISTAEYWSTNTAGATWLKMCDEYHGVVYGGLQYHQHILFPIQTSSQIFAPSTLIYGAFEYTDREIGPVSFTTDANNKPMDWGGPWFGVADAGAEFAPVAGVKGQLAWSEMIIPT